MMKKIIQIDENKCIGCQLCVNACKEGAIGMVDGKAKLLKEDHCDGLGNCLPVCPAKAISFIEKEVDISKKANEAKIEKTEKVENLACGCPGTNSRKIERTEKAEVCENTQNANIKSELSQWPVQIKLVPVNAPYFKNADVLVSADCAAYAYGNFHAEFIKNRVTLIGCPKLDEGDYTEKLTAIFTNNEIKSVTVARMEVPCCGGIENAVRNALINCAKLGKLIEWKTVVISTDGKIIKR